MRCKVKCLLSMRQNSCHDNGLFCEPPRLTTSLIMILRSQRAADVYQDGHTVMTTASTWLAKI